MLRRTAAAAVVLLAAFACNGTEPFRPTPPPGGPAQIPHLIGTYTVVFTASVSCSLPDDAARHAFPGWMREPLPGQVVVDVEPSYQPVTFVNPGFNGTREGDLFSFSITGGLGDSQLGDKLANGREVYYDGSAIATRNGTTITGTFNGRIEVIQTATGGVISKCDASDHKIEFVVR